MNKVKKNEKGINSYQEIKVIAIIVFVVIIGLVVVLLGLQNNSISKPEIKIEPEVYDTEWRKSAIIKITKDSKSKARIVGYNYCINDSKSTDNCDWKLTTTKNIEVYKNGTNYVHIRALDENDKEGDELVTIIKIDNDAPNVSRVRVTNNQNGEITLSVEANDTYSNIKYYYGLNEDNLEEAGDTYTFKNLEANKKYDLMVKVVDEIGNSKIVVTRETAN